MPEEMTYCHHKLCLTLYIRGVVQWPQAIKIHSNYKKQLGIRYSFTFLYFDDFMMTKFKLFDDSYNTHATLHSHNQFRLMDM